MTTTARVTVTEAWPATAQVIAAADTVVMIVNTERRDLSYVITESATVPTLELWQTDKVVPDFSKEKRRSIGLKNGDYLWLAMERGGTVTMYQGDA